MTGNISAITVEHMEHNNTTHLISSIASNYNNTALHLLPVVELLDRKIIRDPKHW